MEKTITVTPEEITAENAVAADNRTIQWCDVKPSKFKCPKCGFEETGCMRISIMSQDIHPELIYGKNVCSLCYIKWIGDNVPETVEVKDDKDI